jgi:hypothetical protein
MIRKFMQCVAAALCCLPAVSIAASDDPKELERLLAKIRSEPKKAPLVVKFSTLGLSDNIAVLESKCASKSNPNQ